MKCPRCQQDNPPAQTFCGECGTPRGSTQRAPSYAEVTSALTEALEQQSATSEILRTISASPMNLQPVLDAVAERAARLCQAFDGSIFMQKDDRLVLVAHHGSIPAGPVGEFTLPLVRGTVGGRAVLERRVVHVTDLQHESQEFPEGSSFARRFGHRTIVGIPMLREGVSLGCIQVRRVEVQPFTEQQLELLQTFADQAVIAIENVRLFHETKEALEQQTATGEILNVISSSPTDVQPVFETIAARAKRLCDARECAVFRFDGELIHLAAQADTDADWANALRNAYPRPPGRGMVTARAIQTRSVVHVPDVLADPEFELTEAARASGVRTTLSVPMIREGEVIGAITMDRGDPKPFLDKEIGLVKTFADQAVIAIENVRLFNELQTSNRDLTEALDRQTATSEILKVISSSPTEVQPVFDAIASSALRLCDGIASFVFRHDGTLIHLAAIDSAEGVDTQPLRHSFPAPPEDVTLAGRVVRTARLLYIADIENDP